MCTIVQLNEMGLLVQGLVNGVIDAAPISIPSNIRAKNLGFTELFDMTKIGKPTSPAPWSRANASSTASATRRNGSCAAFSKA